MRYLVCAVQLTANGNERVNSPKSKLVEMDWAQLTENGSGELNWSKTNWPNLKMSKIIKQNTILPNCIKNNILVQIFFLSVTIFRTLFDTQLKFLSASVHTSDLSPVANKEWLSSSTCTNPAPWRGDNLAKSFFGSFFFLIILALIISEW